MAEDGQNNPDAKKPSILSRFRQYILLPELTPRRVAWSFAIGCSIAWNPIIGTHTWVALALCFLVKGLHRPLLLTSTFLNNPWTMIPIASVSVFFGNWLLHGVWWVDLTDIAWKSIGLGSFTSRQGFAAMYAMLKPILGPYLLGGFSASLLVLPIAYWSMLLLSRKLRKNQAPERLSDEGAGRQPQIPNDV